MGFMVGFVLILVSSVFIQSAPVVRQATGPLAEIIGLNSEFDELLAEIADLLPPDQFELFQQDLLELILEYTEAANPEEINPQEIETKLLILLEKYLGPDLGSRSNFQHVSHKVVNGFVAALSNLVGNTFGKRQATGPLAEIIGLNSEFDELLAEIADLLPPDQFELFQQDLLQLILEYTEAANPEEINPQEIETKLLILLEKYLGPDLGSRSNSQHVAHKVVNGVVAALSDLVGNTFGKRQITDDIDAILAAAPQLAVLINPINDAIAELAGFLSPDQLKSLQQQAIQLILSLAAGKIDENQFKERLQALVQQYLGSNGRTQVDIDKLIQQVVGTDTAGLPDFILNMLSENNVNVNHAKL